MRMAILALRHSPHPRLRTARPARCDDHVRGFGPGGIWTTAEEPPQFLRPPPTPKQMVAERRPLGLVGRLGFARPRRTRLDHGNRVCWRAGAARKLPPAANCDRGCPNGGLSGGAISFGQPWSRRNGTIPAVQDRDRAGDRRGAHKAASRQHDYYADADHAVDSALQEGQARCRWGGPMLG